MKNSAFTLIALSLALIACTLSGGSADPTLTPPAPTPEAAVIIDPSETPPPTEPPTPATAPTGERAFEDRPDDHAGLYQIHVLYTVPSDGVDLQRDLDGSIAASVGVANRWLAGQTGGPSFRLDTYQGDLDITFISLPDSEESIRLEGRYVRDTLERTLREMGVLDPYKLYVTYYEGQHDFTCADGAWPPVLPGQVVGVYPGAAPNWDAPPCSSNPLGADPDWPGYADIGVIHEIVHALGMAPECGLNHHAGGHTDDDNRDLMWAPGGRTAGFWDTVNMRLDVGNDDYYGHGIPGCPDLARSAFLDPTPPDAEIPALRPAP